jgi:hypothetical protein
MATLEDLMIRLQADPSGISEGMSKGKKLAAAGGAAIAAAVAGGMVRSLDISASNDKLAAQLGLSEDESARIGKVAGDLYANAYGESIEDVNGAVGAVMSSMKGMRTASSEDISAIAANALDLAAVFEFDVARSAQVAGQLMSTGLAESATEAFDLITAASQRVPANLREDVLDAADEYGQFFASLGVGGEDAFAMIVDAAETGMYGIDKVGDSIKEFSIRATDGSKASVGALEDIGLNAAEMSDALLKGGGSATAAFGKIVGGLKKIKNPTEQAAASIALFGTPLEDLNVTKIPEMLAALQGGSDAMEGFEGAANRMGTTLNDNAKTNLTAFKRQVEMGITNAVGGVFLPVAEKVATFMAYTFGPAFKEIAEVLGKKVIPMFKKAGDFIGEHETTFKIVAGVITGILIPRFVILAGQAMISAGRVVAAWVLQQVAAIKSALIQTAQFVMMMGRWLALGARAVISAAVVVGAWVLMGVQSMIQAARMAAAWLIAMGPIGLVIAAVIAVAVLIYKYWDEIKAVTIRVWKAISGAVLKVWEGIKTGVKGYIGFIVGLVTGVKEKITGAISGAFDAIPRAFKAALNLIIGALRNFGIPGFTIPIPFAPDFTFGGLHPFAGIPMLAEGGDVKHGGATIVGEQGPEMLSLGRGARVTPLGGGGGTQTVQLEWVGNSDLIDLLRRGIRQRGGNPVTVLGSS